MDIPIILLIIGLISIIASFFIGNSSSKYADELEKVSISLHQETNGLKKRLKAVEEELMISVGPLPSGQSKRKQHKTCSRNHRQSNSIIAFPRLFHQ